MPLELKEFGRPQARQPVREGINWNLEQMINNFVRAVAIGPTHNTESLEIGVCGEGEELTPESLFSTFIKKVFIDVV